MCVSESDLLIARENSFIIIHDQSPGKEQTSSEVKSVGSVSVLENLSSCEEK